MWDLRKQACLATINKDEPPAKYIAFDPAGKFLAYGVSDGKKKKHVVNVVPAKDWDNVCGSFDLGKTFTMSGLVWTGPQTLVVSSSHGKKNLVMIGKKN